MRGLLHGRSNENETVGPILWATSPQATGERGLATTPDRRLAAIMVADVAGFGRLMEAAESHTFARMRRVREEVVNPKVGEFGGRVIKTTGDGFLAEFASAIAALRCGIDIQRAVIALEASQPIEARIRMRIGINVGDIIIDGADIAGDGVNVAARLETMAPVDGICISSMVHDQIRDDLGVAFEDLGQQQLKNIQRPVRAFTVNVGGRVVEEYSGGADAGARELPRSSVPAEAPASRTERAFSNVKRLNVAIAGFAGVAVIVAAGGWYWHTSPVATVSAPAPASAPPSAQASALSIMVLPFANGTGDPQQAYIADGLTSTLTSDLSRIRDAFVVATATAFAYKDKPVTVQQIGKDLGVRFVLQGNVQRSGSKLRINAQLADASSNAQLWSESFDGDQSDLFALQDQVTTRIANTIGREMVIVAARESEARKSSPKVADLMLRAAAVWAKPQSVKKYREMESFYRQALALDPNNSRAMVGLANSLALLANNFPQVLDKDIREAMFLEARGFALKAKELDPDDPGVYLAIAIFASNQGDFDAARRADETRLSLDPKSVGANNNLAGIYIELGDPNRAIELLTRALRLDPKHPTTDMVLVNLGSAYLRLGDNEAAIDWLLKALERNPSFPNTYAYLAMAYALKGDETGARKAAADLRRVDPNYKLANETPSPSSPPASKKYFEERFLPAWRKAGLPE